MNAYVIHVGHLKKGWLTDAVSEYEKRLMPLCPVRNIAIDEERLPDKPSPAEISQALRTEGERILRAMPERCCSIALCVEGKQLSSEELAALFARLPHDGFAGISFVIGSSYGLSEKVKAACGLRLSFSRMTFPHQLMRLMLAEQVYRAAGINAGSKYHK